MWLILCYVQSIRYNCSGLRNECGISNCIMLRNVVDFFAVNEIEPKLNTKKNRTVKPNVATMRFSLKYYLAERKGMPAFKSRRKICFSPKLTNGLAKAFVGVLI